MNNNPRTVEDVIKDFKGRRGGIIKALTKDVEDFYQLCDPNNPNLCLYGFPDQSWEVNLPPPSDLPEPRLGINFARDTMSKHEWLTMVAIHSDSWLHGVATYFASKFKFDKADRKRLFNRISDVSSVYDAMEGIKAKKRAKIEGGGLPEDMLVEEVLSRLPAKDLLKNRSVCRLWRSLIDDPRFISVHLETYKVNSKESHLLVVYNSSKRWSLLSDEQVLIRRGDSFRKVMDLKVLPEHRGAYDLCYVDGVVLVKKGKSRAFCEIKLWNPSINASLNVPNANSLYESLKEATYFEFGFGCNASRNDYKVVAIVYPQAEINYSFGERYRAIIPGLVHVYTLSTNSWCSNYLCVSPPPYWTVGKQVFIHGAIHWINLGPNARDDYLWYTNKDSHIVSFDVENEVFRYFELPSGLIKDNEPKEKFPTIMQGLLCIFCAHENCRNDIWVMREYGVPGSWSKCYTFTLDFDNLMHFSNNGELLYAQVGKGIKSYDVKKDQVRDLARTYSKSAGYTIFTYVESLVLAKQIGKCPKESTS